ncbi:hypothetical protein CVT24_007300 [Panaeolus cyanescens]|uniref:BRCT domain-containing protein n=1 Tax=Panaeolus cyanescens TaxID=181874 RepID=A0A409VJ93_9AGAR|nr:hypothetical protein CVT24_007300 [Panaeolus cyanescens]
MPESIFPEKRTRSQVILPDNILQVADASPMKLARNALKNQLDARSSSRTPVTDSEDELLLSPNKKGKHRRKQSGSKRSASPTPQDEYNPGSQSPLEGRELKRVKRDSSPPQEPSGTLPSLPQNSRLLELQSTTPGHSRTNSEPNVPTVRRSNRKRSATTNKPPPSTASASPPRTFTTPPPSPRNGRAQSVPLFTTGAQLPRVDFRNLAASPKRARSRSKSPSKEKEKLRIVSGPSSPPTRLPTIEDNETTHIMDVDETNDVPKEIESASIDPATMQVEPPSTSHTNPQAEAIPETPRASSIMPHATLPTTVIPFTPATQSLNKFIPLSPLTPLPETPWVGRVDTTSNVEALGERIGWGLDNVTQSQSSAGTVATSVESVPESKDTSKRRAPPAPMAPSARPPSKLRDSSTMPPPANIPQSNFNRPQASSSKPMTSSSQTKNAFAIMMGRKPQQAERKVTEDKNEDEDMDTAIVKEDSKEAPTEDVTVQQQEPVQLVQGFPVITESQQGENTGPADPPTMAGGQESNGAISSTEEKSAETPLAEPLPMVELPSTAPESPNPTAEKLGEEQVDVSRPELQPSISEPAVSTNTSVEPAEISPPADPLPKASKLPLGKKRVPSAPSVPSRVTRSISKQKDPAVVQPVAKGPVRPQPKASTSKPPPSTGVKRKLAVGVKKGPEKSTAATVVETPKEESNTLPPGSPMKITSPGKPVRTAKSFESLTGPSSSPARPPEAKTPAKFRALPKPMCTPSPAKIARATSALTSKPSVSSITRTFSMGVGSTSSNAGSTLSTLSNALEKLRMPPPSRPNTSMGFNRETADEDNDDASHSRDDGERPSTALGRTESIIQRSATLGNNVFKPTIASSNKVVPTASKKPLVQKPLSMFMGGKGVATADAGSGAGTSKIAGRFGGSGRPLFANAPARRILSKKTSLPTLIGSPVKGGKATMGEEDITMMDDSSNPEQGQGGDVSMSADDDSPMILDNVVVEGKGKAPASRSILPPSSRILSVSHALSESLSALPRDTQPAKGLMGPPATPPKKSGVKSTSSTFSGSASSGSPSTSGGLPTRSSARIAKNQPAQPPAEAAAGPSTKKDAAQASAPTKESLKILNDCVIFVDVKTDDGDEAGSLFVEMLEGVGAKVLSRVGQSCTHIVYKNGLSSTFSRYKLLRDPKPLVVGIGWVVECVEKRHHVDEKNFLVDLDTMNATANNKRRRSILPRLLASDPTVDTDKEEEGDISMDGSTSSITMDDHIAPLEKARRRQSFLPGRP